MLGKLFRYSRHKGAVRDVGFDTADIFFGKFSFDTAENEPSNVCYRGLIRYNDNAWIPFSQPSHRFQQNFAPDGFGCVQRKDPGYLKKEKEKRRKEGRRGERRQLPLPLPRCRRRRDGGAASTTAPAPHHAAAPDRGGVSTRRRDATARSATVHRCRRNGNGT